MNFILLGLLWFCIALLYIGFINMPGKKSSTMIYTGIALIGVSFLAGLFILFAVIVM